MNGPTIVCTLHHYYSPEHLDDVAAEMLVRGAPELRGYFDKVTGMWFLREGTHRLRAAHRLGLVPRLRPIPWWRSAKSLRDARIAAALRGHRFDAVDRLD